MSAVELEIPARSAYVGVVRLALSSLARSAGLDEDTVDDLKMAVSEACANAVLSNEQSGKDEPVQITWSEEPGRVVIEIGDRGVLYEGGATPDSWDSGRISARVTMSVALLSSLVDECEFIPRPGGGMRARLVVNR
jgi:anti-sigma regulatory factor (Ser/Thr protein kinase)